MTATTNGASLEDCLTNIFSLIDLNGIRWKRFKLKDNANVLCSSIDTHPILTTYAKCIEENHIAVWRQEPQKRHLGNQNTNTGVATQSSTASSTAGPGNPSNTGHNTATNNPNLHSNNSNSNTNNHHSHTSSGSTSGHINSFQTPPPNRTSNNNTPTSGGPNNLTNSGNQSSSTNSNDSNQKDFELWIFGYGHQLKVDNVIGDDLQEIEDENWDSKGLSYECRTLLFKALHNLIERCLLAKGFTKLGRWFVQPISEDLLRAQTAAEMRNGAALNSATTLETNPKPSKHMKLGHATNTTTFTPTTIATPATTTTTCSMETTPKSNLSSTISETINKYIDSRCEAYDSSQCLSEVDELRHTSTRSSSTYFASSLDGSKLSLSFAFSFFVHGDSTICASVDVRQHPPVNPLTRADLIAFQNGAIVRVALAPHGLNGVLNGVGYKDSDNGAATTAFIQQWSKYHPLPKTLARLVPSNKSQNSAMNNFNQKPSSETTNQYNQSSDNQVSHGSRPYLSNLTNMLPIPSQKPSMHFDHEPNEVPPVVEVIVAGYRLRYPSECVFTTSRVVDLYKTINYSTGDKSPFATNKKPNKQKLGKSPLLSERLSDDKSDSLLHSKVDSSLLKAPTDNSSALKISLGGNLKSNIKSEVSIIKHVTGLDKLKEKADIVSDQSSTNITSIQYGTQTIIQRPGKVGFGSNNAPLGPTDLVKLFPTPPSLEQIAPSPSITEDAKDQAQTDQLSSDPCRDNGIDVYKPVECALMPPPPKWAALTNVILSSSKTLRPDCVYKGSSHNAVSKGLNEKLTESIRDGNKSNSSTTKRSNTLNSKSGYLPAPSPLTDQTNKNGFNCLTTNPPKKALDSSILSSNQANSRTNFVNPSLGPPSIALTATFSSLTLPHQRLFNNLHEINSIQLNLLISDSSLAMFKDHNFESCTLCVCNMSVKGTNLDSLPQKPEITSQWKPSMSSDNSTGEFTNECTCGFSALNNRHFSHLSGLFLEDELEITNTLYDPTEMIDQNKIFRKIRLSNYPESALNEEQKIISKGIEESVRSTPKSDRLFRDDKSSQASHNLLEETKIFVIDQLKQQCATAIHSNSSLSKVLLVESFRNSRHLTGCINYYAQANYKSNTNHLNRYTDDVFKYNTVKMVNKNPLSLKFTDYCETAKSIITRLGQHSQRQSNSIVKPLGSGSVASNGLTNMFMKMFGPNRPAAGKPNDPSMSGRNNIFIKGLQSLVLPTLTIDPDGALHMLEHLIKDDTKEALVILNKAILIFSSPIHDWQFLTTPVPENNFEVANLLKLLQPFLDQAVGAPDKLYKDFIHKQQQHAFSARDSPPTGAPVVPTPPCQGPLTWRQFHQAAGRGTDDQCEPQPIPSLLVGHHVEKNHLALSPFALKFWDKLLIEPYAPSHNLFYLVICPDSDSIAAHVRQFFKELSNTYELLKLGKHTPIGGGIIQTNAADEKIEDSWFSKVGIDDLDPSGLLVNKLKAYASKLNSSLSKKIVDFMDERQPPYDPHADRFDSSSGPQAGKPYMAQPARPVNPHGGPTSGINLGPNQTPDAFGVTVNEGQSSNDPQSNQSKSLVGSSAHAPSDDIINQEDEANKQSGIVIYIVDPFSSPSITQNMRTLSSIGLFKCYSMLLETMPENLRRVTQLQMISVDSIMSHSRSFINVSKADQLKALSMNIYAHCRKTLANQTTAKTLTGFGPAAALESFFKTKSPDLCVTNMFTPPFILAPMKDKQTELGEMYGDRREKSSVLFCSYCITEDQRWLLASLTNDKGEMSENTVINIDITDKLKRSKTSIKKMAFKKLMDFVISVMSEWVNPWRLIIGKLGRIGHGELKEWATLMSKRSLLQYSRHLTERCRQCMILPPTETVSILSACLVSLEPDSEMRIMPDQFTSDDRQASFNKCPLSTPEDATATHILVFPTSASIQPSHGNVEDALVGSGLDDDLLNQFPLDDGMDDLGVGDNMDDLFSAWDDNQTNNADPINISHHDTMMSSSNLQMGSGSVGDNVGSQDETLQLLQQPLALGYYISTAKIGQMPNWFWSTSSHLRNSCPVFLKSALHIHMPCVQSSDDLLHSNVGQGRKGHQLDSNFTTDVLRYVLEGYNSLSWLALNPRTYDRQSCLPVHMQNLIQLYHLMESFS